MRRAVKALFLAPIVLLNACAFGDPPPPVAGQPPDLPTPDTDPELQSSTVVAPAASEVDQPSDIDFLPDGTAVFIERETGTVWSIGYQDDNSTAEPEEVLHLDDVNAEGSGGLLAVAVSPEFDDDGTVYLYYSTDEDNRVVAWEWESDEQPEPILTGISHGSQLNGGALEFGPEGLLWVGTGDADYLSEAQDPDKLGGKLLRITTSGEAAEGNPDPDSPVYSLGHRNIRAIAFRDGDPEPVVLESSPNLDDYVNQVRKDGNYGWPRLVEEFNSDEYLEPIAIRESQVGECAGATFIGDMLVTACQRGQRLWLADIDSAGEELTDAAELFMNEFGQLHALAMGDDGLLWAGTYNRGDQCDSSMGCYPNEEDDRILRISLPGYTSGIGLT
ncbi:PQQ-dependent sugar dehydrogenase [Haloglycomyces albus]|uniref:PQQ-dependent sugar dehydrogenase n=1 Tax=Haloglycomyces albus TaxID=526067 RepID=UPI00046CC864|nr:PQQ-dependent sugar dehydrogenase [Haloglycomyces albus]